ncbi:MAG: acyltransferase [Campylobacterota bacterium]|nr:acyltransferase [Campylobacterota bacterium]
MRLHGIDILRGLAVSVVVLYHFYALLDLHHHGTYPIVYTLGQLGVPLFFVISGYLIYRSIDYSVQTKGTFNGLKHYTLHRLFRILPAYYVNLFVVFIIAYFFSSYMNGWSNGFILKQILSHLTFTPFFIYQTSGLGVNGAYWTLGIEMLWYILAPLMLLFIKKERYFVLLFLLSFAYLLALDLGYLDALLGIEISAANYLPLMFYWSFQIYGQLIYFIVGIWIYKYTSVHTRLPKSLLTLLVAIVLSLFLYTLLLKEVLDSFTLRNIVTLTGSALLFILLFRQEIKILSWLSWIGKISYSMYLWHMPILFFMKRYLLPLNYSMYFIVIVFVSLLLIVSSLSYYYIEKYRLKSTSNK